MNKPNALQTVLAVLACKTTRGVLRLLKRGGTALPGKAARVFAKDILSVTSEGMEIIVVTGTNGKTTTCRMLEQALEASGKECLANKSGANLLSGVTAELTCNATWLGKPKTHYAVIECDEGALKQVVPLIKPKVIVVTNLFRDQLDRYGEITHTLDAIRTGVKKVPESIICLNADESLTSSLAFDVPNKIVYYGMNTPWGEQKDQEVSDAKYCIRCGKEYKYTYHTYAHLGGFYCPECGYKRHDPEFAVTRIDEIAPSGSKVVMNIEGREQNVTVALPAIYNLYNAIAAVCGYSEMGFDVKEIISSLAKVQSGFGRMETFDLNGSRVQMILVKNPTGCNQALEYAAGMTEDMNVVLCLNDRTADGHDISWIWDADYEAIADRKKHPNIKKIYVSGDRAEDMQLRLKYAGADESMVELIKTNEELLSRIKEDKLPVYILPNYTSMLALRKVISQATGAEAFWK